MNPNDFSWAEDQQVTVKNPTEQPFNFKVHNKEYQLGANKSAKMAGYIAWVYVYNMASQLAQADGQFTRWNEEGFRQTYYEKVVVNIEAQMQAIEEEPEDSGVANFDEEDIAADAAAEDAAEEDAPAEPETPEPAPQPPVPDETTKPEPAPNTANTANVQPMTAKKKPAAAKPA